MWGRGRHRGGPIPPSKIRKEHTFPVLDTLQCGCTHLWGLHLSPMGAPISGDCTQLWELHLFLRVCPSPGMHLSWGGCTHPLGYSCLQGMYPSAGVCLSEGAAPLFGGYLPGCTNLPRGATLSRGHNYLLVCIHLQGMHPSFRVQPSLGVAPLSKGCSPLLLGTHLRVSVGALAAVQGCPGCSAGPWGCPRVPACSPQCPLSSSSHLALLSLCPHCRLRHAVVRVSAACPSPPRLWSCWRETSYF